MTGRTCPAYTTAMLYTSRYVYTSLWDGSELFYQLAVLVVSVVWVSGSSRTVVACVERFGVVARKP